MSSRLYIFEIREISCTVYVKSTQNANNNYRYCIIVRSNNNNNNNSK